MKSSIALLFVFLFSFSSCGSETKKGPVRDLLKKRFEAKLQSEPAPSVDFSDFSQIKTTGLSTGSMDVNSLKRFFKIYIPKSVSLTEKSGNQKLPVVFAFHGGGGDMTIQSNDDYYQYLSSAEKNNYIVIFPNGFSRFPSGRLATWNAGACCGEARNQKIDDVGFITALVNSFKKLNFVNPDRIFAAGMSNGGMMAYQLACSTKGLFKGFASVTGTDNTVDCASPNPSSMMHIHAKDDDHVLFNGGKGDGAFEDQAQITDFVSVPATMEKWRTINKCDKKSEVILKVDGAVCEEWASCSTQKKVRLCVTDTGGHSWPGGSKPDRLFRKSKPVSKSISATDQIWQFFSSL